MSDDRTISGTVRVTSADSEAKVAKELAYDIWHNTHRESPNMETMDDFLEVVRRCARSLKGHAAQVAK